MNNYITGSTIKSLREKRGMTQSQLGQRIGVGDKAVSKWETGRGLPDITLMEPLAQALGVSVIELLSGDHITNQNRSCNVQRSKLYVCPICGNILHASGDAVISCCGVTLPALEAEELDDEHMVTVETVEDEQFITVHHPMTKEHYISFLAWATSDRFHLVKFYPEGNAETRLQMRGFGTLYVYCNRHNLMKRAFPRPGRK